jgi:hypothetical protein
VTEDQQMEAIKSLAVELNRLSHAAPSPSNEDDCANIAVIVRSMDRLCANNREGVAKIIHYLCQLAHGHDDTNEEVH